LEGSSAVRTGQGLKRGFWIVGHLQGKGISHLDEGGDFFEGDGAIGVQEAVIAYFHESGGEDVLQETADELQGIEGHSPQPAAPGFGVSEEDGVVFHLDDAAIGDRHLEDIRGEVMEASFGRAYRLGVDIPIDLPDFRGDLIQEAGVSHDLPELGLEDFGERFDGEIKIDPGGMPEAVEGREGASGNDVMDMGVILQGSAPGM